jgi:hypothetical protein
MKGRIKFMVLTIISLTLLALPGPQPSFGFVITFEGLHDLNVITNHYSALGVTFENAIVLVSGAEGGSLNEFSFPPHSGDIVASPENSGFMFLKFDPTFIFVGGFFTYSLPEGAFLTLTALDSSANILGTVHSTFYDNTGESGNPPNEFLSISGVGEIKTLQIDGPGDQWTLDDFTATGATPIPEPATIILVASGLAGAFGYQKRRLHKTRTNS